MNRVVVDKCSEDVVCHSTSIISKVVVDRRAVRTEAKVLLFRRCIALWTLLIERQVHAVRSLRAVRRDRFIHLEVRFVTWLITFCGNVIYTYYYVA